MFANIGHQQQCKDLHPTVGEVECVLGRCFPCTNTTKSMLTSSSITIFSSFVSHRWSSHTTDKTLFTENSHSSSLSTFRWFDKFPSFVIRPIFNGLFIQFILLTFFVSIGSAFAVNDLSHFSFSLMSQQTVNSPISSDSPSTATIMALRSNLSCYVCTTIDDMRCKFINETNRHLYEILSAGQRLPTDEANNLNENLLAQTVTPSASFLSRYGLMGGSQDNNNNNNHRRPLLSLQEVVDDFSAELTEDGVFGMDPSTRLGPDSHRRMVDSTGVNGGFRASHNKERIFGADCLPDEQYCIVLRLGFSSQTSQEFSFFALQRSCAKHCMDGCFIIGNGERTKLSFCTTCCTSNYCNVGSGTVPTTTKTTATITIPLMLMMIFVFGY